MKTKTFSFIIMLIAIVYSDDLVDSLIKKYDAINKKNKVVCSMCKDSNLVSNSWILYETSTLVYCGDGYYDTLGDYHPAKPCNTTTRHCSCSRGHYFTIDRESW